MGDRNLVHPGLLEIHNYSMISNFFSDSISWNLCYQRVYFLNPTRIFSQLRDLEIQFHDFLFLFHSERKMRFAKAHMLGNCTSPIAEIKNCVHAVFARQYYSFFESKAEHIFLTLLRNTNVGQTSKNSYLRYIRSQTED